MGQNPHANFAIGAVGGIPYGTTKQVNGVPKFTRTRMRTLPLGPSAELPMGPQHGEGCVEMGGEPHANFAIGAFGGAH
eukprot:167043-Pyramimonas_sp.AAC.1